VHVDEALLAGGTRKSTERLLAEHSIVLVVTATFAHDQIIEILELFLMDLKSLASVCLVCKLFGQCFHNVTQSVLEGLIHLGKVCLLVQRVLHFFHPLCKFISQVIQGIFQVGNSLDQGIEGLLTDTTTGSLRNLEVGKGVL